MSQEQAPTGVDSRASVAKNPLALALGDAAALLSQLAGQPITVALLERDLAQGAPRNADGTLNLVHYAAWLVKEVSRGA